MTIRRLSVLQWVGLVTGAAVWACAHVIGYGVTLAACEANGARWGIDNRVWQGALLASAALLAALAEVAALAVLYGTRGRDYEGDPPDGRVRFFAITAATANLFFFTIVVLDLAAQLSDVACRQAAGVLG